MSALTKTDRTAIKLAIRRASRDKRTRELLDGLIAEGQYRRAMHQAAFNCQMELMGLKPWEIPPVWVNDADNPEPGFEAAAKLLREMRAHGVSRWHPSPLEALARAKKRRRSAA